MTGCPHCDDQTPPMSDSLRQQNEAHRAIHDFGRVVADILAPTLERLESLLERMTRRAP